MSQPWTHTAGAIAYPRTSEHYVEPYWCSKRLFEEEKFVGKIYDPAAGFGRIIQSARDCGHDAWGTDIVDREGFGTTPGSHDFFATTQFSKNLVSNPPFDVFKKFTAQALLFTSKKVALIMPTARLNAARWLQSTPLQRVWLMTPRPSMPPGHVITAGGKVGGGKSDYCWLVFERGYRGTPELRWLTREKP